jgi:hypothetical protein
MKSYKVVSTKPKIAPSEEQEQILTVVYLEKLGHPVFAIPNGGRRGGTIEGYRLKRGGVRSGVPDLCIPIARKGYHGLYLELKKTINSKLSDNQIYWLDLLTKQGYLALEAKGFDQAKIIIDDYFKC